MEVPSAMLPQHWTGHLSRQTHCSLKEGQKRAKSLLQMLQCCPEELGTLSAARSSSTDCKDATGTKPIINHFLSSDVDSRQTDFPTNVKTEVEC